MQLAAMQQSIQGLKFVASSSLHMTVAFIGEAKQAEEERIVAAMQQAAALFDPVEICLGGLGSFQKAKVLYCGLQSSAEPLADLSSTVMQCFREHAIERRTLSGTDGGQKWFTPHVTLARVKAASAWAAARDWMAEHDRDTMELAPFLISHIHLYESQSGGRYAILHSCSLTRACSLRERQLLE